MSVETLQAYELLKKEKVEELHGTAWQLRHKKTGAKLFLVSNEDENKVFTVGFRTPPEDSTGVAHIIEHSVLCGSRKFPAKDPFVELVKGSLNTFLNAMTYPDKTLYPVASCNEKDFQNLMDVYLDAVFHPNIYSNEKIFRQEGWHYELSDKEAPITLNGVVYNEMKGALSTPDSLLDSYTAAMLFPDNTYAFESGGDPEFIPDLSYEQFLDFHRKYYHPSNSYLYLYGNMDMEEKLRFLDEQYLSHYEMLSVDSKIPYQKPFDKPAEKAFYYPVMEEEPEENGTYLSYNAVTGTDLDPELYVAMQILEYVLLDAPGAPLKQALLDRKIGKDVYGGYGNGILQPYFSVIAKETEEEKKEEFTAVIESTLQMLVSEGIKKSSIRAAMNYFEFKYREADFGPYPKGLMYGLQSFDSWLYDEDPLMHLKYKKTFEALKEKAEHGYFEELISRYLLNNPHKGLLILIPKRGMEAEKEEAVQRKLAAYKESLKEEEILRMIQETEELKAYQEAQDSDEVLKSIPMLHREDISREIAPLSIKEARAGEAFMIHHELETSGITYLDFLFDMGGLTEEELSYAGLLPYVLGFVDTKDHSYQDLFDIIYENSGGLNMTISAFGKVEDTESYRGKFDIRIKVLEEKTEFAFEILKEILTSSNFAMEKRLYEIIAQQKSRMQMRLTMSSDSAAVLRAASYSSQASYFNEITGGIAFYQFIEEMEKRFDERKAELIEKLQSVAKKIFSGRKLLLSVTSSSAGFKKAQALTGELAHFLPGASQPEPMAVFGLKQKNEGFQYSSGVQYVARYGNFKRKGLSYTGALRILRTILNYDYLWLNIRVKGGAYGCSSGFGRNGAGYFTSYRDPNLEKTNQIFDGVLEYVKQFQASERDMTKYVIGTISGMDTPLTPQMKGNRSLTAYLSGITEEMLQEERRQVLEADSGDIRKLAPVVEAVLSEGSLCVLGNDRNLARGGTLLKEIKPLFGRGNEERG